jgi:hypothetical protein
MSLPFAMWIYVCPNWPCKAIIIAIAVGVVGFGIGVRVGKTLAASKVSPK